MPNEGIHVRRLLAEGLAIILSILAAFAIDAWWDVSQENKRLDRVLRSLENGLSESVAQIDDLIVASRKDGELVRRFLLGSASGSTEIPPDSTFATLQAMALPRTGDNNITFLSAGFEDQGVKSIDDAQLASAIASWRVTVGELEERSEVLATLEIDILQVLNRHPEVARLHLGMRYDSNDGSVLLDEGASVLSSEAMGRLRRDGAVVALGATKSNAREGQLLFLEQLKRDSGYLESLIRGVRNRYQ